MGTQLELIIHKYQKMISNIRWHLDTNKPTDKMEIQKCNQQIIDYEQVINDLKTVAGDAKPAIIPSDTLQEKIREEIANSNLTFKMVSESLQNSFYKETGIRHINSQGEPDIDYVSWLERKIFEYRQFNNIGARSFTFDNMMDIAGWMAAADPQRPVNELKEEALVYISKIPASPPPAGIIMPKNIIEAEKLAHDQFKHVGDEGLFPNHSDKDIWICGFRDAIMWCINHSILTLVGTDDIRNIIIARFKEKWIQEQDGLNTEQPVSGYYIIGLLLEVFEELLSKLKTGTQPKKGKAVPNATSLDLEYLGDLDYLVDVAKRKPITIMDCKNKVAQERGYPSWKEYYNWIARDGQLPAVVATLIENAVQHAMTMYHEYYETILTGKAKVAMLELINFIDKNYEWFLKYSSEYGVVPRIKAKAIELLAK